VFRALTLLVFATAVAIAACGDDDSDSGAADRPDRTERSAAGGGGVACGTDVEQPAPRRDGGARKPKVELNPAKTYEVSLETSCGEITIRVDQRTSPKTAASFVSLAESGFYDDTVFHRIVPDFVIQGGDPTGTGTGGPGYSVRDVPPPDTAYTEGVVAMAKSAAEPPGTAGSQFYIVTAPDAGLPPEYAVLGKVVRGLAVVQAIGALGDPASGDAGTPRETVVIEGTRVRES
jgi:peptidyl-prolyl cis-trans isomerase B (cyclophilin B)